VSSAPVRPAASRRGLTAFVILTLLLTIGVATVSAVAVGAGYRDHSYAAATSVTTPTKDKPQSKVWYTDGFWWAGMMDPVAEEFHIYRLNASTQTWVNTGTAVDIRNSSQADYLWVEATDSLYVVSAPEDSSGNPILVFKLNYNASNNTYSHDGDFTSAGVQVGSGPTETVTIARDSTGQLWVTYDNQIDPSGVTTTDRNVMVNRSTTAEDNWGTPFSIGTMDGDDPADPTDAADLSAIIAFGGDSVGVMWSDERPDGGGVTAFRFRSHADSNADDTAWTAAVVAGSGVDFAEDHIHLTLAAPNSDRILAAVKTNGGAAKIQVLERESNGTWTKHAVVSIAGSSPTVTRPQIVVDSTNARAYVFYVSPENFSATDANIYYKSAPLSTLSFSTSGLGTAFIDDTNVRVTDVSTTKHNVTSAMGGILGIASGDSNETYYHGWISLAGPPPTPTPDPSGHPFTDIETSQFKNSIIWAWENGITTGCSATKFCPNGLVTRAQMATFLSRALDLPSTSTDYFTDDEGSVHEANINKLRAAGITAGCGPTTYCPNGLVTRAQMATFLGRAYSLPGTSTDYFTDDEGNSHEARINALRAAGITTGCSPTTYCPNGNVTRGQMAAFLNRAENQ
jgi:hypothetical protein